METFQKQIELPPDQNYSLMVICKIKQEVHSLFHLGSVIQKPMLKSKNKGSTKVHLGQSPETKETVTLTVVVGHLVFTHYTC